MDTIHFHSVIINCAMFSIATISKVNRLPKKKNQQNLHSHSSNSLFYSVFSNPHKSYHQYSLPQEKGDRCQKTSRAGTVNTHNPSIREMVTREAKVQA